MPYEFKAFEISTYDNEMGKAMTQLSAEGWELFGNPQFTKYRGPAGWNEYAVGHHPHFLMLFRRETSAQPA